MSIYVTPRSILSGRTAEDALARGWAWAMPGAGAFTAATVSRRTANGFIHTQIAHARREPDPDVELALAAIAAPRSGFAGLKGTTLMGVLNTTPDSFSDGGKHKDSDAAIAQGVALAEAGAAIIDVGGESTRPGAEPVSPAVEIARTEAVIRALANRGLLVSIDSRNGPVMEAALAAGARILNDITALTESRAMAVAARSGASVVLMHMQGDPRTMQADPRYDWAPADIHDYLRSRIAACAAVGIPPSRIAIDPGLGFGKTAAHSMEILDHMGLFHSLGVPVAVGASRKSFIGRLSMGEGTEARLAGSIACALEAAARGVQIIRVHDVAETRQALALRGAVAAAGR